MKKLFLNILTIAALVTGINTIESCHKAEDLVDNITVPVPFSIPLSLDARIPLTITDTDSYQKYPEIPMNLDTEAEIQKKYPSASLNNLKAAKLDTFSIEYVSSDNGFKLDVIKNANIYISTPQQGEVLIATAKNNTSETQITFAPVDNVDLLSYLKSKQNSLVLEIQGEKIAADMMNITINASFKVEIGI